MTLPLALAFLTGCQGPAPGVDEQALLPRGSTIERLAFVSQIDELDETVADHARCAAAATLSAYLLLGGDFASLAERFGVDGRLTYGNVHRLQEALYDHANLDGEPGILGGADPSYDDAGRLVGWSLEAGDEYHLLPAALGLEMGRVYAPTKADAMDRRAAVASLIEGQRPVAFIVGVDEDMQRERFKPMGETGNHYVVVFPEGGLFRALDSYRTPGRTTLITLTPDEVEAHLLYTRNAIIALRPTDRMPRRAP